MGIENNEVQMKYTEFKVSGKLQNHLDFFKLFIIICFKNYISYAN